jgi:hypothetical protein
MGVADQFPELGEGADVWNPGENYIQRCLFVVDQGLVSCRLPWLCVNTSLHTYVTHFVRCLLFIRPHFVIEHSRSLRSRDERTGYMQAARLFVAATRRGAADGWQAIAAFPLLHLVHFGGTVDPELPGVISHGVQG